MMQVMANSVGIRINHKEILSDFRETWVGPAII